MADIRKELAAIMAAVYGEEVRGSIHDAIAKINEVGEATLTIGTAVTDPTSSVAGYFEKSVYINANTNDLWVCTGDAWELKGNIKGDKGDKGEQGNKWFRGTAVSGKSATPKSFNIQAAAGDMYVNVTEQSIYHCTEGGNPSRWSYDFTMSSGGGGSVDIDGVTITENAAGEIQVAESITTKLSSLDNTSSDVGKVLTAKGNNTTAWEVAKGGHDMLSTVSAVEAITSPTDDHVVSAYVVKGYSNRYTVGIESTLTANNNEITITDSTFANDDATFEFMFEPNANNEVITLASYTLDTTSGVLTLTVVDAPTLNTKIRVDVTVYREEL